MSTPLAQQIQDLFNQAKLFSLTHDEIEHRSDIWARSHDPAQIFALMRTVDPKREVYKYPVSKEEDLKLKLGQVFEQAKFFTLSKDEVQHSTFELISDGHTADELYAMMAELDPERLVFDHPIRADEKGINGLELWQNRYRNVSDTYGHNITPTAEISDEFVERCEQLWEDGVLYHHGGLSVDRRSGKGGYTVVVALDHRVKPVQADLDALKAKYGLTFECIAMELKHNPKTFGATVVIAALITDVNKLPEVPEIAQSMDDLSEKWLKRFERKAALDDSPSP